MHNVYSVDIDECSEETSGCSQLCTNTIGSYTCTCHNGYQLKNDHTCTDIDECSEENGVCEQTCANTIGSFTCSCASGYSLISKKFCTGMIINIISTIVLLFEQILMNVKQIMEDANKIVITMLEVTTVHVIMASV